MSSLSPHISHDRGSVAFNYRVCGVALHNEKVLAVQISPYRFWVLPGGRGEYLESSRETLEREIEEETGYQCKVGHLAWIAEDFYSFEDQKVHEIAFYYLIDLPDEAKRLSSWETAEDAKSHEEKKELKFRWIPIDELPKTQFFPEYLKTRLAAPPRGTEHIIYKKI